MIVPKTSNNCKRLPNFSAKNDMQGPNSATFGHIKSRIEIAVRMAVSMSLCGFKTNMTLLTTIIRFERILKVVEVFTMITRDQELQLASCHLSLPDDNCSFVTKLAG